MMTADIIPMREAASVQLRRALDDWHSAKDCWVEKTLALALVLKTIRDECGGDDRAFGFRLLEIGCDDLGSHDRAALVKFAENIDLARKVLPETVSRSLRLIWEDEIRPRISGSITIDAPVLNVLPIVPATPEPEPINVITPAPSEPEKSTRTVKITTNHSFHGLPCGEEVAAVVNQNIPSSLRELFRTRAKKEAWELILQSYKAGFLQTGMYSPSKGIANLRVLFPATPVSYAKRFSFHDKKDRDHMRNTIMPAALAHRDELLAAPEKLEEIVKRYEQEQRQQVVVKVQEERLAVARQKVSPLETDVVLYGKRFWPIIDITDPDQKYDYRQLQAAAFLFAETRNIVTDADPKACGMKIRFMIKPLVTFNRGEDVHSKERERMRRVLALVTEMTRLMEDRGHSATVGDIMPMRPHEEG